MEVDRLLRMKLSLDGLSVGDAFGERFFVDPFTAEEMISSREIPEYDYRAEDEGRGNEFWAYTDDTLMALSVAACLAQFGEIDQDWLAQSFAEMYDCTRGYGPAMHGFLARLSEGRPWRKEALSLFGGQGSFGNGAAMRVGPVGAYFADDLNAVVEQAALTAVVTHAHDEAVAGAIAVAVGAALAARGIVDQVEFLTGVIELTPESVVREKLRHAIKIKDGSMLLAVSVLGNGVYLSAQDTVPFALWCASRHLRDYENALWLTVGGLGDRDTTCAMAGGIVALSAGERAIPQEWLAKREPLPDWIDPAPKPAPS